MNLHLLISRGEKVLTDNAPLILTCVGATGVLTTSWLTGKASIRAYQLVDHEKTRKALEKEDGRYKNERIVLGNSEIVKLVWKLYLPAGGAAVSTIAAIILANRIGTRRTAALAAAYAVSDKAMSEYKEKVVEKLGKKKEREVRDEIHQEKLKGVQTSHIQIPGGQVLMFDSSSMRTFVSSMEKVRKIENDLREVLLQPAEKISVADWQLAIGLKPIPNSDQFGWNSEMGFKLDYSAGLTDDNLPCLVWHFVIEPKYRVKPTDRFQI